jgi:2-polyprenyl-3-methyl-5-hydroxy-6-metoxy-1,4-benzoquinol methylase
MLLLSTLGLRRFFTAYLIFNKKNNIVPKAKLHSEEYFGEQRNFWWNQDFIELMGKRLELQKAKTILDVGCGVGHWGRVMHKVLSPDSTIIGIDQEEKWIAQARLIAEQKKPNTANLQYQVASAESIPFEENLFDLVTCQTLLIHVPDPELVIREMIRVLRPGGTMLFVEPNNQAAAMIRGSHELHQDVESRLKIIKLQMVCEAGKSNLGLGFNSIGDKVPLFLKELGVKNIQVHQTDRSFFIIPPYETEDQRAMVEQAKDWAQKNFWIWDLEETRKYFLAGGGDEDEFNLLWSEVTKANQKLLEAIDKEEYCTAGGCVTYLISGHKAEEIEPLGLDSSIISPNVE